MAALWWMGATDGKTYKGWSRERKRAATKAWAAVAAAVIVVTAPLDAFLIYVMGWNPVVGGGVSAGAATAIGVCLAHLIDSRQSGRLRR